MNKWFVAVEDGDDGPEISICELAPNGEEHCHGCVATYVELEVAQHIVDLHNRWVDEQ